jgi:hypothetical protein
MKIYHFCINLLISKTPTIKHLKKEEAHLDLNIINSFFIYLFTNNNQKLVFNKSINYLKVLFLILNKYIKKNNHSNITKKLIK